LHLQDNPGMPVSPPPSSVLPLFPLQSVLFPGGVLPLNIFEVRYLDMIGRCHRDGTPFGVVCLTQGREVRRPPTAADPAPSMGDDFAPEAFHTVGTLARIELLERPQPGLMMIRCIGTQRFRLRNHELLKHGLWVGEVELLADDVGLPVPPDLAPVRAALEQLVRQWQAQLARPEDLPVQAPYRWDDCGWLANRWCELLPISPELRQRFMVLESPLVRLELVADLLAQLESGGSAA
jgi:Lon protease-like protein